MLNDMGFKTNKKKTKQKTHKHKISNRSGGKQGEPMDNSKTVSLKNGQNSTQCELLKGGQS